MNELRDLLISFMLIGSMTFGGGYAMILMDVQMPVINGLDATRAIRQIPGLSSLPILAMTAGAFDEDRNACLEAGMNDHIVKPVDPDVLYARMLDCLQKLPCIIPC